MSTQPFRLASGGLIERDKPLRFTFNGTRYQGYAGDTLAAALLANGVHLVGRSFKYHRARGIVGSGAEEPNALVQLGSGARTEPNLRATQIELHDGLAAHSQNCWPSVAFDIGSLNNLASRLLPAGFYYKTFMWPPSWWPDYERCIRAAAGMGRSPLAPDPDHYAHHHVHCDVLVAGAGAAGLAAALAAARSGARVILADENFAFGGSLLAERVDIDEKPAGEWIRATMAELEQCPAVTLLARSTVFGYFDHNLLGIAQHVARQAPQALHLPRQRLWKVRAKQVVLATGAIERPLVFADNDLPGIMLASAARTYVNRYAVRAGTTAVVFTNNDGAYSAALDLHHAGIKVTVVDARETGISTLAKRTRERGIEIIHGHVVTRAHGARRVGAAAIARWRAGSAGAVTRTIACDLLCYSGGYSPVVHLHTQAHGKLRYDETIAAFLPDTAVQAVRSAGAANGAFTLDACLTEGYGAGTAAAQAAGLSVSTARPSHKIIEENQSVTMPLWDIASTATRYAKRFVDFQNDVTSADIALAAREGYGAIEHLKRYTTLGMGTDQGKLSNINGIAILSGILNAQIPATGMTTFRPPYTAVTFGTIAGTEIGADFDPLRLTPLHAWHEQAGAHFINAALWKRAQMYPRAEESALDCVNREARAVRHGAGIVDVSTLGKIELQGRDAAEFLDRVYANAWKNLPVGKARYGIMLREDGMVFDDGTTTRLADWHYLMTTTTGNATRVMSHLEYWLQVQWPELDVQLTSVTEQWAGIALAGPAARTILAALADADVSDAALPYMGYREARVAGIPARIFRISFSGELAYEINVPSDYAVAVWEALLASGKAHAITPYGTEAMAVLRIEKGHLAAMELDGRTTPDDLGLARMVSAHKDSLGKRSLRRPALAHAGRKQLVGLLPVDGKTAIPRGAQLVADPNRAPPNPILGHVTSNCFSPALNKPIALALLAAGRSRHGEILHATAPLTGTCVKVQITSPVFYDPDGARLRG